MLRQIFSLPAIRHTMLPPLSLHDDDAFFFFIFSAPLRRPLSSPRRDFIFFDIFAAADGVAACRHAAAFAFAACHTLRLLLAICCCHAAAAVFMLPLMLQRAATCLFSADCFAMPCLSFQRYADASSLPFRRRHYMSKSVVFLYDMLTYFMPYDAAFSSLFSLPLLLPR